MESHQVRYLFYWYSKWNFQSVTPSKVHRGHSRSPTVFLPITWDPNEIETWYWCHCICLRKPHRMMYSLTYLSHRVTLPWLDLRSNFDLNLSRSHYTLFDVPWRDKHDRVTMVVLSFKIKTLSSKNHFGQFWPFDFWWPQFWPELKMTRVVSEWFLPSFRTPFSVLFYDAQEPR